LVFTNPDGTLLHPAKVTDAFYEIVEAAGYRQCGRTTCVTRRPP
jgi:hypothetical protein